MVSAAQERLLRALAHLSSRIGEGYSIEFAVSETVGGTFIDFVGVQGFPSLDSVAISDLHELVRHGYVMRTRYDDHYQVTNEGLQYSKELDSPRPNERDSGKEQDGGGMAGQRDPLTGLLHRGALDENLPSLIAQATRRAEPLGLVMVDLDHFKLVNDTHGHLKGDAVLRAAAERLSHSVRSKGDAYRYGGEEITLVLPNHGPSEALAVAERARRDLEATAVAELPVTASFGVACLPAHAADAEGLINSADKALYAAKNNGRNLVSVSGEPPRESSSARTERDLSSWLYVDIKADFTGLLSENCFQLDVRIFNGSLFTIAIQANPNGFIAYCGKDLPRVNITGLRFDDIARGHETILTVTQSLSPATAHAITEGFDNGEPQQFDLSGFDIYALSKDSHTVDTKYRLPLPTGITCKKGIVVGKVFSVSTGGAVHMRGSK